MVNRFCRCSVMDVQVFDLLWFAALGIAALMGFGRGVSG